MAKNTMFGRSEEEEPTPADQPTSDTSLDDPARDEPATPDATETTDTAPTDTPAPDAEEQSPEEFRAAQKAEAERQNLTADNAVPEQRPQAFLQAPPTGTLTRKLEDEGYINNDPMPPEAFTKAASQAQMDKAAENSRSEQMHPGSVVRVTQGPHEGRVIAVTRITEYEDAHDLVTVTAGVPEARFVRPAEIEGRARGDERDGEMLILNVEEAGLEIIRDWRGTGRG